MPRYLIACLFVIQSATGSSNAEDLWLDVADVVVPTEKGLSATFIAPGPQPDKQPMLWIAPRVAFMREWGTSQACVIEVNGQTVGLDRLRWAEPHYVTPCGNHLPPPVREKCAPLEKGDRAGEPAWVVRMDNDFVSGDIDLIGWRRIYATEGLEPSYVIDLTGLIRPGRNELTIHNLWKWEKRPKYPELVYPEDPSVPTLAIHAKLLKVGMIDQGEVRAWNAKHTGTLAIAPRTFDIEKPGEYEALCTYYKDAAPRATTATLSALMRLIHASFRLWKHDAAGAARLLAEALETAPDAPFADQMLFLLGVAQTRTGHDEQAAQTWLLLERRFKNSIWRQLAERERTIVSWQGAPQPINWPHLEIARIDATIDPDGRLDEPAWSTAPMTDSLCVYQSVYEKPPIRTEIRALYDQRALYIGIVCFEPGMSKVSNPAEARDGSVWGGDAIELFLDPQRTYTQVMELSVGANGVIADFRNVWEISYVAYDPPQRRDAVHSGKDRWSVEMVIPWTALDVAAPQRGHVWLGNVVRVHPYRDNDDFRAYVLGLSDWRFAAHDKLAWFIFR